MEQPLFSVDSIGVVVTAVGTIVLAAVTFVLAKETKRLADVGERPSVVVTFEPNLRSMLYLDMIVQNVGTAPAYEIELSFDPELEVVTQSGNYKRVPLRKISILKPQQQLTSGFVGWNELKTKAFAVHATWKKGPTATARQGLSYNIDLNLFEGMSRLGSDPQVEAAQAIKKIADEVGHLGSGYHKLKVDTFDAKDREKEQQETEEWIARQTKPQQTKKDNES